jgi:hypothetical protein
LGRIGPEGGQRLMSHLCMVSIGFVECDFGDTVEVWVDGTDDQPIRWSQFNLFGSFLR